MDSWRFTLFFGLQSNTVIIYFVVQTVSALTTGTFQVGSWVFWTRPPAGPSLPSASSLPSTTGRSRLNCPRSLCPRVCGFSEGSPGSFYGRMVFRKQDLGAGYVCCPGLSLSPGPLSKAKQYIHVCTNPCRHTYGELVLHRVCMCVYRDTCVYTETDTKINTNSY